MESFELEVINNQEKRAAYFNLFERMRLICSLLRESMTTGAKKIQVDETDFHEVEMPFLPPIDPSTIVPVDEMFHVKGSDIKTRQPLRGAEKCVNILIQRFPFYGRTSNSRIVENDFYIGYKAEQLSRGHCSIEQRAGGFIVRDRFSSLGTKVNGEKIGKDAHNFVACSSSLIRWCGAADRYSSF